MSEESQRYRYISDSPDYRHLDDKERYKALYEEVGTVDANRVIRWREEWMKYFRPRPRAAILELGAHNGPNLLHYARLGHTVCGVELSATLLDTFETALHREPAAVQARISVHQGWIEEFVPVTRFDEVLCTEILEHVIDPVAILKVARAAVTPNGRIYISSPTSHWGNNTHVRGVPVADLRKWLDESGLRPIEIWSENDRTFCIAHESDVRVIGMTRIRNESAIIADTLDHMARFCSGGVFVYDDASTDNTAEICAAHPMVRRVVQGKYWDSNRGRAEYENRAAVMAAAQEHAGPKDWLVYLDADERIEFHWPDLFDLPPEVIAVRMKLFDFYITPKDAQQDYRSRQWMGPEYRPIVFAYRNLPTLRFRHLDQREVELGSEGRILDAGYVKHYGKAISIQQWEETCSYYSTYFPVYAAKWNARRNKAVHTHSDFGRDLIRWEDKETRGVLLTPQAGASVYAPVTSPAGGKLRILLSNHQLLDFTGSELFTFTLADFLRRTGHDVTVYSRYVDKLRQPLDAIRVRVVDKLATIQSEQFDLAHVHHNITAMEVRHAFPNLALVYLSHGVLPFLEQPPAIDLQVARFLAVSEEVRSALAQRGVPEDQISIFRNIVDSQRFSPSSGIGETPKRALILSARIDERRERVIRDACAQLDITATFLGGRFGEIAPSQLPVHINEADIVFSLGRGAIETMMCGRIPIIFDYLGGDGMVTPENLQELMSCNFSGRRYRNDYSVETMVAEIRKYKSENGLALRALALDLFDAQTGVGRLMDIYKAVIEAPVSPMIPEDSRLLDAFIETIQETRTYTYNQVIRNHSGDSLREPAISGTGLPLPATGTCVEDWLQSIRSLESLLWLNDQDPSLHHQLGLLHYHTGDKQQALGHLQRASAMLPDDPQIRRDLGVLYPEIVTTLIADLGGRAAHEQSLETHAQNLQAEIENLRSHAANLDAARVDIQTHAANLEEAKASIQTHAVNLETLNSNLRTHAANLQARNAELETHVANVQAHAAHLEVRHADLGAHVANLEAHIARVEQHAKNLEVRTADLQGHATNLESERLRLTSWVDHQQRQLETYTTRLFGGPLAGIISQLRQDHVEEVVIYGAGEAGQLLISMCRAEQIRIRCAVDSSEALWGKDISGIPIVSLSEAMKEGTDVYAVASLSSAREISRDIRDRYASTTRRPRVYAAAQKVLPDPNAGALQPASANQE